MGKALDPTQPEKGSNQRDERKSFKDTAKLVWDGLGWGDRLLPLFVIVAMIFGVVIGEFAKDVKKSLTKGDLQGTPAPLAVGLIVMMWPILTKVQYEKLPAMFKTSKLWSQILTSLILNWIVAPLLMLGLAWATLPDLPGYRVGVILVGIARCIAMVMIWNDIAKGDGDICAIIVIINSVLQIVLYAPIAILFVSVISNNKNFALDYSSTAICVVIYLGIPLVAGVSTRITIITLLGKDHFKHRFLPYFGPLSLIALLYVIIIIFAEQARSILDNLGPVFRTFVPLVLYFAIVWSITFTLIFQLSLRYGSKRWGYQMAVVQSFTAASNNFELAIAVCVAVYGADSQQSLAATIGPLVEVPVLLILSYVSLYLSSRLSWEEKERNTERRSP